MATLRILHDVRAADLGLPFDLKLQARAGALLDNVLPHVAQKLIGLGKAEWVADESVNDQATAAVKNSQTAPDVAVVEEPPIEVKPTAPLETKPTKPKWRK